MIGEALRPLRLLTKMKGIITGQTEDVVRRRNLQEEARVRRILRNPNRISQNDILDYEVEMLEKAWRAKKNPVTFNEESGRLSDLTPNEIRKEILGYTWERAMEMKLPKLVLKI